MDNGADSYKRFIEGDDSGLAEIVREYRDDLTLFLYGYVRSFETAEELCEDTFFRLITKRPVFGRRSSFKTWLFAVGRNLALDYLRKNAGRRTSSFEQALQTADESQTPYEILLKKERNKALYDAMDRLLPQYREVLYLTFLEEFSNGDAAKIMKKSARQVELLKNRAKSALRAELERTGFEL